MHPLLQPIKELIDQEKIREADELILDLRKYNDPKIIGELITLLDDKCDYDEVMYTVIQTMEALGNSFYVSNFLERAERLLQSAPDWAGILLIRIVNGAEAFSILKKSLSDDPKKKSVVNKIREYSMKIKKDMPVL